MKYPKISLLDLFGSNGPKEKAKLNNSDTMPFKLALICILSGIKCVAQSGKFEEVIKYGPY